MIEIFFNNIKKLILKLLFVVFVLEKINLRVPLIAKVA